MTGCLVRTIFEYIHAGRKTLGLQNDREAAATLWNYAGLLDALGRQNESAALKKRAQNIESKESG